MATLAAGPVAERIDVLSGAPRACTIDRWLYVFTAALFIVTTLTTASKRTTVSVLRRFDD
jgi:hypothetical protein